MVWFTWTFVCCWHEFLLVSSFSSSRFRFLAPFECTKQQSRNPGPKKFFGKPTDLWVAQKVGGTIPKGKVSNGSCWTSIGVCPFFWDPIIFSPVSLFGQNWWRKLYVPFLLLDSYPPWNSQFAPENRHSQKETIVFQPSKNSGATGMLVLGGVRFLSPSGPG